MKKILVFCLALVMVLTTLLTGCGSSKDKNGDQTTATKAATQADSTQETTQEDQTFKLTKYDPAIEVTINMLQAADQKYAPGESIENTAWIRWLDSELGVKMKAKWVAATAEDDKQKLNLAMASNDLPDIIKAEPADLMKLARANALQPLDDVMNNTISPLGKYIVDEFKSATTNMFFLPTTVNGKIYGFPLGTDIWSAIWNNNWIRTDILDELGLPVPTSLDELEKAMLKFKEKYPDGTPFATDKDFSGMAMVFEACGAYLDRWIEGSDGKLIYTTVQPEMKTALGILNKWYGMGLIDKEFIVKDWNKGIIEPMAAAKTFTLNGAWWHCWWPMPDMQKNDPKAQMLPMDTLKGPDGKQHPVMIGINIGAAHGIRAGYENPEVLFNIFNENMDSFYRNDLALRDEMKKVNYEFKYNYFDPSNKEEGKVIRRNPDNPDYDYEVSYSQPGPRTFWNTYCTHSQMAGHIVTERAEHNFNMFLEGDRYIAENPGFVDELRKLHGENTEFVKNSPDDPNTPWALFKQNFDFSKLSQNALNEIWQEIDQMAYEELRGNVKLYAKIKAEGRIIVDKFVGAPTQTMVDKNAYLLKLRQERFAKIIMGTAPLNDFDKFVEEWKKAGGDQIVQEVNEWYQTTK